MKKIEMIDHLLAFMDHETLLNEIVQGLDASELDGVYRHILRMWDLGPALDEEDDEDDEDDDDGWREEIAMEAGMGLGIDAYNDARGYSVGDIDEDYNYGE